jgi:uncharacterized protein
MPESLLDDPVLSRFRAAVDAACGDRIERVVLFGSRARGDHGPDSDYDIAVFLNSEWDVWDETGVLARITTDILPPRHSSTNAPLAFQDAPRRKGAILKICPDIPSLDPDMSRMLSRGYETKSRADDGTGPEAVTSTRSADETIEGAARFMEAVERLL